MQKISKNINKKVISRDTVEYKFDININDLESWNFENLTSKKKRDNERKEEDEKLKKKMAEYKKTFRHGQSNYGDKKDKLDERKNLLAIKAIGTK